MANRPLIVVSGLAFEAQLAQGEGVQTVYGLDRTKMRWEMEVAAQQGVAGFLSFGTAGGLSPEVRPGHVIIGENVHSANGSYPTHPTWSARIAERLQAFNSAHPQHALSFHQADIYGADVPAITRAQKAELNADTGAAAIDMESHLTAEIAARYRLPFAVIRVVLDGAETSLPPAALAGMRADGTPDIVAVLIALIKNPRQLPAMMALARDHNKAKSALLRSSQALRLSLFGLLGVG